MPNGIFHPWARTGGWVEVDVSVAVAAVAAVALGLGVGGGGPKARRRAIASSVETCDLVTP